MTYRTIIMQVKYLGILPVSTAHDLYWRLQGQTRALGTQIETMFIQSFRLGNQILELFLKRHERGRGREGHHGLLQTHLSCSVMTTTTYRTATNKLSYVIWRTVTSHISSSMTIPRC